jgi:23S rRNA (cytosine1962-C5)-methyltransferase
MHTIRLKPGRQKSLLRHHPWVFSGAIDDISGTPSAGETVRISDTQGVFIAWGAYSPHSKIRVRIWSWKESDNIDVDFFASRLENSFNLREDMLLNRRTNAMRLVHAESDDLPGLILDRYSDVIVIQSLSCGIEHWKEVIADLIMELTDAKWLFERSDAVVRKLEGLENCTGVLRSRSLPAASFSPLIEIFEGDLIFWVDVVGGQKTGFYLDQRANRARIGELSDGRQVLDCFSYTGGFAVSAVQGGAESVTAIESSSESLEQLRKNLDVNRLRLESISLVGGDVFQVLRNFRDGNRKFDMIVLDPPKFAPTRSQVESAARGYKDINLLAIKLLRPRGLLVTFSCSGGISMELFQKILTGAALDAGRDARIVEHLFQDVDHPMVLNFPEGSYLKGFVLQV